MTRDEIIQRVAGSRYDAGYMTTHALRYAKSLAALSRHLQPSTPILDIGWPTIFDDILIEKGYPVFNGDWDIRKTWPRETGSVPAILLMEVVEHLKDVEPGSFDTFTFSGLIEALVEAKRVLKPGGLLFLTTPNIASVGAVKRLLSGNSPVLYGPHVREYTAFEIEWQVSNAGFHIVERTTEACYEETDPTILEAIKALGGTTICRDDTTFLFATT